MAAFRSRSLARRVLQLGWALPDRQALQARARQPLLLHTGGSAAEAAGAAAAAAAAAAHRALRAPPPQLPKQPPRLAAAWRGAWRARQPLGLSPAPSLPMLAAGQAPGPALAQQGAALRQQQPAERLSPAAHQRALAGRLPLLLPALACPAAACASHGSSQRW